MARIVSLVGYENRRENMAFFLKAHLTFVSFEGLFSFGIFAYFYSAINVRMNEIANPLLPRPINDAGAAFDALGLDDDDE